MKENLDWLYPTGDQDWLYPTGDQDWLYPTGDQDWLYPTGDQDWLYPTGDQDWLYPTVFVLLFSFITCQEPRKPVSSCHNVWRKDVDE